MINTRVIILARVTLLVSALSACSGLNEGPAALPIGSKTLSTDAVLNASSSALLYASNVGKVTVYTYPNGKLVHTLQGFYRPEGECVDAKGNVYITDIGNGGRIYEYAHGANKRTRMLQSTTEDPVGCAVDSTTGDLAVSSLSANDLEGTLAVYKGARGKPTIYTDSSIGAFFFCGYDPKGNLYVDGEGAHGVFEFAYLPKGETALKNVSLDENIDFPGGVQWDGQGVAIGDQSNPTIYRFTINGSKGVTTGKTQFQSHWGNVKQFFIQDDVIIAPNGYSKNGKAFSNLLFFSYPTGGKAVKTITDGVRAPDGVVISDASTH